MESRKRPIRNPKYNSRQPSHLKVVSLNYAYKSLAYRNLLNGLWNIQQYWITATAFAP